MLNRKSWLTMTTAVVLAAAPMVASAQTAATPNTARGGVTANAPDGTPGNPPSTATQRAVDSVTGNRTPADGTPGNPPGTALGRALGTTDSNAPRTAQGAAPHTAPANTATGATTPAMPVDSMNLRDSRRASQIIGSNIYNSENTSIGEVDDLIVPQGGGSPVAVVSVGGFLGIGAKLVTIPYDRLTWNAERSRWMLPSATKDSLQSLPSFDYDSLRGRS